MEVRPVRRGSAWRFNDRGQHAGGWRTRVRGQNRPPAGRAQPRPRPIGPHLSVLPVASRRALAVTKSKELFGVFCNSPSDCWAVGEIRGKNTTVNQVLHWTGKRWFGVKVPNQAGTAKGDNNELLAVRCTSAKDCWALGDSQQPGGVAQLDQALHFDGRKWTVVQTPVPGGTSGGAFNVLDDISCTSARNCWAVGDYGLTGTSMQLEVAFNQLHVNVLKALACTAKADCWAVGAAGLRPGLNEAMHWNGAKWSVVPAVNGGGTGKKTINILSSVRCLSHSNCWAVGDAELANDSEVNQILHWNGTKWTDS
jgi:hypothetical protein